MTQPTFPGFTPGDPGTPGPPVSAEPPGLDPPAEDGSDRRRLLALAGPAAALVAGLVAYLVLFSGGDPMPEPVPVTAPAAPAPADPAQADPTEVLPLPGAIREDPMEVEARDRGDDPFEPLVVEPASAVDLTGPGSTELGGDDVVNPPADSSEDPGRGETSDSGDDPSSGSDVGSDPSEEFPSEEFPSEEPSDPASVTEVPPSGDDPAGTPGAAQPVKITVENIDYRDERVAVTVDGTTYRPRLGRRFASHFRFVGVDRDAKRATFRYTDVTLALCEDEPLVVYGGNRGSAAPGS